MFDFRYDDLVRVYRQSDPPTGGPPADPPTDPPADPPAGDDAKALKDALDKERNSNKTLKQEIKDLKAKVADSDTSKTELQKAQERLDKIEQDNAKLRETNRTATAKDEVTRLAKAAGAPDTDAIWKMARADLKYDDETNAAENAQDIINGLKADHPDMFKVKPGRADLGGGDTNKGTGKSWMRQGVEDARRGS